MSFSVSDPRFDAPPSEPPRAGDGPPFEGDTPRRGRGCLFWGCLTLAVVLLVLLIGFGVAVYFTLQHFIEHHTADRPLDIAVVELPEDQMRALEARFEAFEKSIQQGQQPPDLEISARELNALVAQDPDLRGRVFVRIADGKIGGDLSLPMDDVPGGRGRYLNASVDFHVAIDGGSLIVTLADAKVNGAALPPPILKSVAGKNLAEGVSERRENAEVLRQFESLRIVDDKILLQARRNPAAPAQETGPRVLTEAPPVAPEIESMDEAAVPTEN
jgi:hypothetical protein